ncbi:MAG: hypothetical protein WCD18_22165 [Thermosynechococcaceae cyanobacterium]
MSSSPATQLPCAPRLQANTWVKLLQLPSPYSFDEALLICQVALDEWLAWVPDYGEIRLNTKQFYCIGLD